MDKNLKHHCEHDDIQALLEMARALAATCDLDKLLQMVVNYSMELLDADRATLFLYDSKRQELYSRIAEGTSEVRIPVNTGLAGAAARTLKIVNVPDAYQDPRFNPAVDKRTGYRTRSILACPLTDYEGHLVGVLQILNKGEGKFGDDDIALAQALSAQAGVALQRAHLLEQYLEKQRLEQALATAKEIQQKLFPRNDPALAGFDIACWNRQCDATGGDCCDFLRLENERLVLTLGDVSGHGVGPALLSCAARAMLRAISTIKNDVGSVMRQVNRLLSADLADNRFVTMFMGILDAGAGRLNYCSAGQAPLLWLHGASDQIDILAADGIPLGILSDFPYTAASPITMEPGDIFALLTDGFYEWARSDNEPFGVNRAAEVIKANKQRRAGEVLQSIILAVEKFADTAQTDDLTAMIIKRQTLR